MSEAGRCPCVTHQGHQGKIHRVATEKDKP
jgi:hypothetical protein